MNRGRMLSSSVKLLSVDQPLFRIVVEIHEKIVIILPPATVKII